MSVSPNAACCVLVAHRPALRIGMGDWQAVIAV